MHIRFAFVLAGVLGCTPSSPSSVDQSHPVAPTQPKVVPDPEPAPKPTITVQMTAATLADDCGGGPNTAPKARRVKTSAKRDRSARQSKAKAKRRCEQSSIQLAIDAPAGVEPAQMAVKSVELFLESGKSVGMLEARAPSLWSEEDGYIPWDQKIEPTRDLSVSYALAQPDWSAVEDRWNQTYTVKAVLSIAGADQAVEQDVEVAAPTSLPPNVKT